MRILLPFLAIVLLANCGRKELPAFEVFVKQGDRIMKAMDQQVKLANNDFTLLFTFGQLDTAMPYGIQWVATTEADVVAQFKEAANLQVLNIPFTDTIQPTNGQIITQRPVLMQYTYTLNDNKERTGNFTQSEEKFQQLLLEATVTTIDGVPASEWTAQEIGLFIAPMYDHMPMDPFYLILSLHP